MHRPENDGAARGPWADDDNISHLGKALRDCAAHVEAGSTERAASCLARATGLAAVLAGNVPQRRLAVPFVDCLARRMIRPMDPAIADALFDPSECIDRRCVRSARRLLFELSPFPRAAFVVSNSAIIEAVENEKNVHVIDFAGPAAQPNQWIELLHDFHRRREDAPHLRMTVVHSDGEFLAKASELVVDEADRLNMAFQIHTVAGQLETLDLDDLHGVLHLKSGEARAIICTQQLHRLLAAPDETAPTSGFVSAARHFNQMATIARLQQVASTSTSSSAACGEDTDAHHTRSPATPLCFVSPPASTPPLQMPAALASFLRAARGLAPKVMVVTEQDADHNGASFRKRFADALEYYAAVYCSLAAAAAAYRRPAAELAEVEQAVLAEEIRDVLLREGARRRERHDRLQKWAARLEVAGFRNVPLSYVAMRRGNEMLGRCGVRGCESAELRGCLLLCWCTCPLYSVSAWRPDPGEAAGDTEYLSPPSQVVNPANSMNFSI